VGPSLDAAGGSGRQRDELAAGRWRIGIAPASLAAKTLARAATGLARASIRAVFGLLAGTLSGRVGRRAFALGCIIAIVAELVEHASEIVEPLGCISGRSFELIGLLLQALGALGLGRSQIIRGIP
jgi:hypothetical protein